jgi:hypothetical protein
VHDRVSPSKCLRLKFSAIKRHRLVEWISRLAGENNSGLAEVLATGKHEGHELDLLLCENGWRDCARFERLATGSSRRYWGL